jgi:hypothetical protein
VLNNLHAQQITYKNEKSKQDNDPFYNLRLAFLGKCTKAMGWRSK